MSPKTAELRRRLDATTSDRRLLDHPFYRAWAAGTLTMDDLAFYSAQYWRQVEAFPGYLAELERRVDDETSRRIISDNLADERDDDHPQLWLDFAGALGVDESTVRASDPEPETRSCVESFEAATRSKSVPFALGMLYAYESQTPEVAATKIEGLHDHYGIDGDDVTYFALHGELDVEHSDELVTALERVVRTDEDAADAEAGARAGAEAIYGLLDGVARVRNITC